MNHTSDSGSAAKVTDIYNLNDYMTEKRRALDAWAWRLLEIVSTAEPPENVIKLTR